MFGDGVRATAQQISLFHPLHPLHVDDNVNVSLSCTLAIQGTNHSILFDDSQRSICTHAPCFTAASASQTRELTQAPPNCAFTSKHPSDGKLCFPKCSFMYDARSFTFHLRIHIRTHLRLLESADIVGTVPAHHASLPRVLEGQHKLFFLVWRHPCKYLGQFQVNRMRAIHRVNRTEDS